MRFSSGTRVATCSVLTAVVGMAGLASYTLASPAPVVPDADGNCPIAAPGMTKAW